MELYSSVPNAATPLSVGDGKPCGVVKVIVSCSGGSSSQKGNCSINIGYCPQSSC